MTKQDIKKLLTFFLDSAERDLTTYNVLKRSKRNDAALFFLHLIIEKKLKAFIIKSAKVHPPISHDLVFLVARTGLEVTEEWIAWLREISTFNIATRYEDEKFDFYKKADAPFVKLWDGRAKVVIKWIDEQLKHS